MSPVSTRDRVGGVGRGDTPFVPSVGDGEGHFEDSTGPPWAEVSLGAKRAKPRKQDAPESGFLKEDVFFSTESF